MAGLGAMMKNRGDRGLQFVGQDMTTNMLPTGDARVAENIANFDMGMSRIADAGGVANLRKGGRVGYGKGGKVSKGCGKVMAGRNKKLNISKEKICQIKETTNKSLVSKLVVKF